MLTVLNVVTGWLLFLSLALVTGVVASRWFVLPRSPHDHAASFGELRAAAARLGSGASLLLLMALALVLLRQFLEFRDPFAPWSEDARLLLGRTSWGATWLLAVAATVALGVSFRLAARERRGAWGAATVAALALGSFPALTGHANSGDLRLLTLAADTFHVWAVGGWIGGLALVLLLERRQRREGRPGAPSLLQILVPRFSPLAMGSVAMLAATGLFASWVHLEGVAALFTTGYGRLLLLKLALVAVVLALGAVNFKRITPRLGESSGQADMRRAATLEFLVANVVLAVTAILVRIAPM